MTAATVNKRTTETKYVTCFADARPDVDITFRDVLLSRPTDHYLVGVDNFSMTSTGLSMIEPLSGDYEPLIRIVRNRDPDGYQTAGEAAVVPYVGDTGTNLDTGFQNDDHDLTYIRNSNAAYNFEVSTTEVQLSVQQLMHRLNQLAADVTLFMNKGLAAGGAAFGGEFNYTAAQNEETVHLEFDVRSDGRLQIIGTRAFWGCFSVEVPSPQYQFGFWGDRQAADDNDFRLRRFLSVNPVTGAASFNKIKVNPIKVVGDNLNAGQRAYNARTIFGATPKVLVVSSALGGVNPNTFNIHTDDGHKELITHVSHASIFSTLERRIALEIGCSLPLKNSPMVDHQKETPDFVLGRWIWRSDSRIEANDKGGSRRYASAMPACVEYQGPRDRITYHELQAQAKIQTLRIQMFARVRSFNQSAETWSMRVIVMPTNNTDWWHVRLHFVSKD